MGVLEDIMLDQVRPLPCPFCGGHPRVKVLDGPLTCGTVECQTPNCPASPITTLDRIAQDADEAIKNWNKRYTVKEKSDSP